MCLFVVGSAVVWWVCDAHIGFGCCGLAVTGGLVVTALLGIVVWFGSYCVSVWFLLLFSSDALVFGCIRLLNCCLVCAGGCCLGL